MANIINGIDVSHFNGNINWPEVAAAHAFVYIKATQGTGYTDPMCATNATAVSTTTQMKFSYYHFATLENTGNVTADAQQQANWFAQTMSKLPQCTLIPMLDIEANAGGLPAADVQTWISAFMAQMKANGFPLVFIYSYPAFLNANLPATHPFGSLPLWIADYTTAAQPVLPHGWSSYVIWQYSGSGTVNGVSGQCDLDRSTDVLLGPIYSQQSY
ncbi:MAG: glycoside hydrolase family 25 protein [Bacteroidetes bacterium]|nr:glycoside hydrolase family 25 protein [Bacteroidota bacterium]